MSPAESIGQRRLQAGQLRAQTRALLDACGRMQMAYAWQPGGAAALEVRYLVVEGTPPRFEFWSCAAADPPELPSLALLSPLLGWYEREIQDRWNIRFAGHPEPRPLLSPGGEGADAPVFLPEIHGAHLQYVPFGPVRGDVVESVQHVFVYSGEEIAHYHPRLFFKHRGMEDRFAGLSAELGAVLAERVSGVGSVAHGLAFCQAVERAAGCEPPARALALRTLLAEMERIYNHLHYFGYLCYTTTLKVGEAQGRQLEEQARQLNGRLTGSRFLRNLLAPGGLRRDLDAAWLGGELERLQAEVERYLDALAATRSHLDRLFTTGPLPAQVAVEEGATGPIARASGIDHDLRRDHPYAGYGEHPPQVAAGGAGDAQARAEVRAGELLASFRLLRRLLWDLPPGEIRRPCPLPPGSEGLGWSESPRGALFYAIHAGADGRLLRVKIKSPSFSNWRVFPFTAHGSNLMDFAINEASFGLTVAGCDR